MIELGVLKLFCESHEIEMSHYPYIKEIENLGRELKLLFKLVHGFYADYESETISKDDLIQYYRLEYPNSKDEQLIVDLIGTAFLININMDLMRATLDQIIEKHHATQVIQKLLPVMEGEQYGVLEQVRGDVDEYVDLLHNPPESLVVPVPCLLSIDELVEQEINDPGLSWHMDALTNIMGGARRKTLGLIYAFVDSGKTSFALAAASAFAEQLKGTEKFIAYCGNEESAERLRLRFIQAITNWTRSRIRDNRAEATKLAIDGGLEQILIFDDIVVGEQVTYILNTYEPRVLFLDQATDIDINTKRKSDGVEYQKQLFKWYRGLAGQHDCSIVGVSQGVGDAENTKWLKLSDIYGSRVAIQGALDYGIGIGRIIEDAAKEDFRYIHVPKNKLHDGDGGKFETYFTRNLCHWEQTV
jgi:hypothetical protein